MKELSAVVTGKVNEMISDGTIERLIDENIEKAITQSIGEAFRSYGGFGKSLSEKIEASVQCAGKDITIPVYNKFIQEVVNRRFKAVLDKNALEHLDSLIGKVIEPVTKTSKISDLRSELTEALEDGARREAIDEIEISFDESHEKTIFVEIDNEIESEKIRVVFYSFGDFYQVKNEEKRLWHIGYINVKSLTSTATLTGSPLNRAGEYLSNLTEILYKYYAMGTKFEWDEDFESICFWD